MQLNSNQLLWLLAGSHIIVAAKVGLVVTESTASRANVSTVVAKSLISVAATNYCLNVA